jgi:hypothetical protein
VVLEKDGKDQLDVHVRKHVRSYWMTLRKGEDILIGRRKL